MNNTPSHDDIKTIREIYELGDYKRVIKKTNIFLDNFLVSESTKIIYFELHFFKCVSYLDIGQYEKVIMNLAKLKSELGSYIKDETDIIMTSIEIKILSNTGKSTDSYELLKQKEHLFNNFNVTDEFSWFYLNYVKIRSNVYYLIGKYSESLNILIKGLELINKYDYDFLKSDFYNNIAINYDVTGEYLKSLEYYKESLLIYEKFGNFRTLAISYSNLAQIYFTIGSFDLTQEYYEKCLGIIIHVNDIAFLGDFYLNLIRFYIVTKKDKEVQIYYKELEKIDNKSNNIVLSWHKDLAEALILKAKGRLKNRYKAQEILTKLKKSPDIHKAIFVISILNLTDILVQEYKVEESEEIYQEIQDNIEKIMHLGNAENNHILISEFYILKAKIELIKGSYTNFVSILGQAKEYAETHNLYSYSKKAQEELNRFEEQRKTLSKYINSNSVADRFEISNMKDYLEQLQRVIPFK